MREPDGDQADVLSDRTTAESLIEDAALEGPNKALNRAETSARPSLYEIEARRFESCGARFESGLTAGEARSGLVGGC